MEIMKVLVAKGADVNTVDREGRTAADRAAGAGFLTRAMFLLESGTRVADRSAFVKRARNHALHYAIANGSVEAAKALLDQGADPDFRDEAGQTLLMIAVANDSASEKAQLLLDHGASANLTDPKGLTALMIAADYYQPENVKALLDHNADPNRVDADGNSVLIHAAASRRSWQEERHPLIQLLLDRNVGVNQKNGQGITALMRMADEGNLALELLLKRGADVNARDRDGNTALLYAARTFVRGEQQRIAWWLLEAGADVNAANQRGETAVILAATQYEPDGIELLLEKHANVNAKTAQGRTALMQSIDGPKDFDNEHHVVFSPKITSVLIRAGADVNARDQRGMTPLRIALQRGYADIAAELRRAGAKE